MADGDISMSFTISIPITPIDLSVDHFVATDQQSSRLLAGRESLRQNGTKIMSRDLTTATSVRSTVI